MPVLILIRMTIYGIIACNAMRAVFKRESRAHNQAIQLRPVCFRLEFDRQSCVKFSCDLRHFKCTILKLSHRFFVDGYVLRFVIIKIQFHVLYFILVKKMLKKQDLNAISLLFKFRLRNCSWQLFSKQFRKLQL